MKEDKRGIYERIGRVEKIREEISARCQCQRDKLTRQREQLREQRLRIAERALAGLANPETISQYVIDEVAHSLLETLDGFSLSS